MLPISHNLGPNAPQDIPLSKLAPESQQIRPNLPSTSAGLQSLRNAQILQASLKVSIQAGNESLALLYRTAVDEINKLLEPVLGASAVQNALPQDNSAEATAGRIVGLSTALFDAYAARHPDKDLREVAQDFIRIIRSGFEQGYQEAQDILHSLGVLGENSPIALDIAKTYELVHQGYDQWLNNQLENLSSATETTPGKP